MIQYILGGLGLAMPVHRRGKNMSDRIVSEPAERKPYSPPCLVCHGLVADLTKFPGRGRRVEVVGNTGGPWVLPDGTIVTPS